MAVPHEPTVAKLKVCLLGDEAVGKTSTIRRYLLNQFSSEYMRTIGTLVSKKTVEVAYQGRRLQADLILWDIMGHKDFLDLLREAYFYKANGLIGVADLSRPETIEGLRGWIQGAHAAMGTVPLEILGNKVDLVEDPVAVERELAALCHDFRANYELTSAKTGLNVERAFTTVAGRILDARLGIQGVAVPAPAL